MEFKEVIKSSLDGDDLANALDLVDFLVGKGLTPIVEWASGCRFVNIGK